MKNKWLIIISFFLLLSASAYSQTSVDQRRAQLIGVIDQELREVTRINQQTNSNNPTLLLRMAELLLEKARLIKEQENTKFLDLSPEERTKINRNKFFASSISHFEQAQKTCEFIIRRFQNFDEKGDVYYIMAYNSKEFNQLDKAQRYFDLAVKSAKPGTTVKTRSQLALAEMYFNSNSYEKAIPLYEGALLGNNTKDRWWTKDSYNLAWSYFRVNQTDKAITLMNQVHRLSGDSNFVDMSQNVERDLAYFYTEAGRTKEAIAFYKKGDKDIATSLLRMARNLINQGKFAAAENALLEAQKHPMSEEMRIEVNIELIALYERFGKEDEHLRAAQVLHGALKAGSLTKDQAGILKYQAARMAGLLQQQVVGKTYERQPSIRQAKGRRAVNYFEIMGDLEPQGAHQSLFHAGETLFAMGDVNNSIKYYDRALEMSHERKDRKTFGLALEGMMMSLNDKNISKENEDQYLEKAFRLQIATNPRDAKNLTFFQRLFAVNMTKNDLASAEKTLLAFKSRYPRSVDVQEAMIAKIMEVHQKNKNRPELAKWVQRIESGEFKVSEKYLKQTKLLLLTMQFENVEKLSTEGEKTAALRGYLEIYKSDISSADAKKNAAYNIASLFYELGNLELTYRWTTRALSLMTDNDVEKYDSTFLTIGGYFYNRRKFPQSSEIFESTFLKLCKKKNNNKTVLFRNAVLIHLASNQYERAQSVIDESFKCNIPNEVISESQLDVLKALADDSQWNSFTDYLGKIERNRELGGDLIYPLSRLQNALEQVGKISEARSIDSKILRLYGDALSRKAAIPLEGLNIVAKIKMRDLLREASVLQNIKLSFPEERHTQLLKALFEQLDKVTSTALEILSTRSGEGIVSSYKVLVESYDYVYKEVRGFTPPDKSAEYIASFKQSMVGLTQPLVDKSREFRLEAIRQIKTSTILAEHNNFFLRTIDVPIDIHYKPIKGVMIMDRGGRR